MIIVKLSHIQIIKIIGKRKSCFVQYIHSNIQPKYIFFRLMNDLSYHNNLDWKWISIFLRLIGSVVNGENNFDESEAENFKSVKSSKWYLHLDGGFDLRIFGWLNDQLHLLGLSHLQIGLALALLIKQTSNWTFWRDKAALSPRGSVFKLWRMIKNKRIKLNVSLSLIDLHESRDLNYFSCGSLTFV